MIKHAGMHDVALVRRFADYDLVARQESPIRFYAGAPLVAADGQKLGML